MRLRDGLFMAAVAGIVATFACGQSQKTNEDGDDAAGAGGNEPRGGSGAATAGEGTGGEGTGGDDSSAGDSAIGGNTSGGGGTAAGAGGTTAGGGVAGSGGTILPGGFGGTGVGGTFSPGLCSSTGARVKTVIRDFQPTWMGEAGHPDFEPQVSKAPGAEAAYISMYFNQIETGIVEERISESRKPVYAGGPEGTPTTMGPAYFPSWFLDTPSVNLSIDYYLEFVEDAPGSGVYVFDKAPFLPVPDGLNCPVMPQTPCLLGNSRNYSNNNYALTLEFHQKFVYVPGLSFTFSGDDDMWVFVNNELVVDLGGIHQRATATVNLDELADSLGLVVGSEYLFDFFWAERHVTQANFRIETSLGLIACGIDVPK